MRICLISPYFGKWPLWFPAFLQSCKYNSKIDWFFFTDCMIPETYSNNVKFIPFTEEKFNQLASSKLGFKVHLFVPYKLCDFKPAYGLIFSDYLQEYDFWGHCDIDIIWGNILDFISSEVLQGYDIISASEERCCGHFQLFRNDHKTCHLFTQMKNYEAILQHPEYCKFDEPGMTKVLKSQSRLGETRVFWPKTLTNFSNPPANYDSSLGRFTNQWFWQQGTLYHRTDKVMYLHFLTWKRSLKLCNFGYSDAPESFYISYSHIGLDKLDVPDWAYRLDVWIAFSQEILRYRFTKLKKKIARKPQLWYQLQSMG